MAQIHTKTENLCQMIREIIKVQFLNLFLKNEAPIDGLQEGDSLKESST